MGDAGSTGTTTEKAGPDLAELARLRPRMLRVALRLVESRGLPADLAADVLCAAIEKVFRPECPPDVPLHKLLVGWMLNEVKRLSRQRREVAVGQIGGEPEPEETRPPVQEQALRGETVLQGERFGVEEQDRLARDLAGRLHRHLQERAAETGDDNAYYVLEAFQAAYRAGATTRGDVCQHAGLTSQEYEAAKRKLRYHLQTIPHELSVAIIELLHLPQSRS